jgi:hypothetical protein
MKTSTSSQSTADAAIVADPRSWIEGTDRGPALPVDESSIVNRHSAIDHGRSQ